MGVTVLVPVMRLVSILISMSVDEVGMRISVRIQ